MQLGIPADSVDLPFRLTPDAQHPDLNPLNPQQALFVAAWRRLPLAAVMRLGPMIVRGIGGIVFPGSPLAATKEELQTIAGFWPDIEKSRTEAKRLLKEAGAEGLSFELFSAPISRPLGRPC